jgi:hypothetical protein
MLNVSGNWGVIDYRRRVPAGVQVVVRLKGPFRCSPQLVQVCDEVLRVRSQSRIEFRNWDVSHFHLLPGLRFIFLDYFVERLIDDFINVQLLPSQNAHTLVSPAMVKERFFSWSAGRCVNT